MEVVSYTTGNVFHFHIVDLEILYSIYTQSHVNQISTNPRYKSHTRVVVLCRHCKENLISSIWFATDKFNSLWPLFGDWNVSISVKPLKGSKVFLFWFALCCYTTLFCCYSKLFCCYSKPFWVLFYNQCLQASKKKTFFLLKYLINLHSKIESSGFTAFVSRAVPANIL